MPIGPGGCFKSSNGEPRRTRRNRGIVEEKFFTLHSLCQRHGQINIGFTSEKQDRLGGIFRQQLEFFKTIAVSATGKAVRLIAEGDVVIRGQEIAADKPPPRREYIKLIGPEPV